MKRPAVLIIDDDPGLRRTLADILRLKGYEPMAARDGAEGIVLLAQNPIDIALIDLGLPDVPGIDLLHQIKAAYPSSEAIILTGNASLDSAIEATNRGAFSYLLKPYDVELLLLHVKRATEKQQAREEIAGRSADLERLNRELKVLYEISSAISRTIDMDRLLREILGTLAATRIFPFENKGAIFLVENGRLRRSSFIFSKAEVEPCQNLVSGECLCGLAVASDEILVSKNSHQDHRHRPCEPGLSPHGHVIVPLKAADRVVGILTIYTPVDLEIEQRMLDLLATIGNQIGIAIENARLYEETKASSLHDPLTGLANRRFLEIQLEKVFDAARRYGQSLAAIMLDIDHFKSYNDTFGHAEGDRLLSQFGGILLRNIRTADYAFRYGGEEFLILLPRANLEEAGEVAERVRKTVERETVRTVSLGVASFSDAMAGGDALIREADSALYLAKRRGRNRVEKAGG